MNGVSKKLCITMFGIQAIVGMAQGTDDKIFYACLIAGVVAVYKVVQAIIDWKSK
jgi:hypothetical protein